MLRNLKTGTSREIAPKTKPGGFYYVAVGDGYVIWDTDGGAHDALNALSLNHGEGAFSVVTEGIPADGSVRHPWIRGKDLVWIGSKPLEGGKVRDLVYHVTLPE